MSALTIFLFAAFIILMVNAIVGGQRRAEDSESSGETHSADDPSAPPEPRTFDISIFRRLWNTVLSVASSRTLEGFEFSHLVSDDTTMFDIRFFAPRAPLKMRLYFAKPTDITITDIKFIKDGEEVCDSCSISYYATTDHIEARVILGQTTMMDSVRFTLQEPINDVYVRFVIRVLSKNYEDVGFFHTARQSMDIGKFDVALRNLKEYSKLADANPLAYLRMSHCHEALGNQREALEYALRAAVAHRAEQGLAMYRELRDRQPMLSAEECDELRARYRDWNLEWHYGIVALTKEEEIVFGIDGWYLRKVREVLLIRRQVAARMLTALSFDFSSSEHLLNTRLQIVSADGTAQRISHEQFSVGDSSDNNIFITTESRLAGTWLLPQLSVDDVIERSYDIFCRERKPSDDGVRNVSVITNLNHEYHPTLEGRVTFEAPPDWPLTFKVVNETDDVAREESPDGSSQKACFSSQKYIPAGNIGFPYQDSYQNPVIACATSTNTWERVAARVMEHNLGEMDPDDELPDVLLGLIAESADSAAALERSFYWIRDKLKYGSIGSALMNIGVAGRAKAIVSSGMADCKDKSYLLRLVCKKLGLATHYVFVSAERGLIIEDLPSDQFDHVFIKVMLNDHWIYLDAADRYAPFASASSRYQGLKGLEVGDTCQIRIIASDDPGKNRLQIVETFDSIEGDWLSGNLSFKASGHSARLIDEQCKISSLQMQSATQSVQSTLRRFLPSMILLTHERMAQTSHSNVFEVSGTHKRCQLSRLKNQLVGTLDWHNPTLPTGIWRTFDLRNLFAFYVPESIFIQTVITGDLLSRLQGFSEFVTLKNGICEVDGHSVRENGGVKITREIRTKTVFVEGDDVRLIPTVLETIEDALQLALVFKEV